MGARVNLTGRKFGLLTVVSYAGLDGGKNASWNCTCDCGGEAIVRGSRLRAGETASCGCLRKNVDARVDVVRGDGTLGRGDAHRALYNTWAAMRNRCSNQNHPAFARYGGRGIHVCSRWDSFENFVADMGERPFAGAELDRINNDGPYSPENCRWLTAKENCRNRRSARIIATPLGDMPIWKAAEVSGLDQGTISARLRCGIPAKNLFAPIVPPERRRSGELRN